MGVQHFQNEMLRRCNLQVKCCGFLGYEDYEASQWSKKNVFSIPASCCKAGSWSHLVMCSKLQKLHSIYPSVRNLATRLFIVTL